MIDIIALEKPLDEALSREELCIMLSKLEENFYPFEVEGEFSAIFGLIRSATADEIMNYDLSPLKKLLADMMNDMQKRANRFVFSKHKREAGISFVFEKYKRYRHSI